jgi:hypothetical protein
MLHLWIWHSSILGHINVPLSSTFKNVLRVLWGVFTLEQRLHASVFSYVLAQGLVLPLLLAFITAYEILPYAKGLLVHVILFCISPHTTLLKGISVL